MFYKLSLCFDENSRNKVENFGYFSTLNWFLINQLEKHCFDKDYIVIEYVLPNGRNKEILIHTDKLLIKGSSKRMYLVGILDNAEQFSHLPVDRIFMVKKVIRKNMCFDLPVKLIKYTISKKALDEFILEDNEMIFSEDDDKVTISSFVFDEFMLIQKLLYYCPDIYYISDERIKTILLEKLQKVRKLYGK